MVSNLGFTAWCQVGFPINFLLFLKERALKKGAAYKIQLSAPSPQKTAEKIFLWTELPLHNKCVLFFSYLELQQVILLWFFLNWTGKFSAGVQFSHRLDSDVWAQKWSHKIMKIVIVLFQGHKFIVHTSWQKM